MKQPALLFINKTFFDFYQQALPNVARYNYLPGVIQNLDVVDREKLHADIEAFITASKIIPASINVILSPQVTFEKEFVDGDPTKDTAESQTFLDIVPFEDIGYQKFRLDKNIHIVAANKELYELIKKGFEALGSEVETISPLTLLGADVASLQGLDVETARKLMSRENLLKKYTLLEKAKPIRVERTEPTNKKDQSETRKKILMIVFVVLLFGGAAVMIFFAFKPLPSKPKVQRKSENTSIETTIPIPTSIPTTVPLQETPITSTSALPLIPSASTSALPKITP